MQKYFLQNEENDLLPMVHIPAVSLNDSEKDN